MTGHGDITSIVIMVITNYISAIGENKLKCRSKFNHVLPHLHLSHLSILRCIVYQMQTFSVGNLHRKWIENSTAREKISSDRAGQLQVHNCPGLYSWRNTLAQMHLTNNLIRSSQALSDPYTEIEAREDSIRERIRELTSSTRENHTVSISNKSLFNFILLILIFCRFLCHDCRIAGL